MAKVRRTAEVRIMNLDDERKLCLLEEIVSSCIGSMCTEMVCCMEYCVRVL